MCNFGFFVMYVQKIINKRGDKRYVHYLVQKSVREGKKVKHITIANLSKLPLPVIEIISTMLKTGKVFKDFADLKQGKSIGALKTISEIARRTGITQALGTSHQANLALFQIAGRIICQGSRNYLANEWAENQAIDDVFNINSLTEDDLYANLVWLSENQSKIEKKLFNFRHKDKSVKSMYLYDVTSSYLEGSNNALSAYGYNRDKKVGKKQIVIGLLTDEDGNPVAVEVFAGNTSDVKTVTNQLKKLKYNLGAERVIFVGDKGMIKSAQIKELNSDEYKWNYLTSITKEQIKTLIKEDVVQLSLFDDDLVEVMQDGIRYILRRNAFLANEKQNTRQSKIERIKEFVLQQNKYLLEHERAKPSVALRKVNEKISNNGLKSILASEINEREISITIDEEELQRASELDGCYVLKTDVPKSEMSKELAYERYKDLNDVEFAFRTMKTTLEDLRPIFVRKEAQTRGHVFVVMLAYIITKYISDECKELGYTRAHIIESLDKIQQLEYDLEGSVIKAIPEQLKLNQQKIINKLGIKL